MTTRRTERESWTRRIAIGGLTIAIECRASACRAGVAALLLSFPDAPAARKASLRFTLEEQDGDFRLTLDGESLWEGRDAGETVAAFEFQFYNRTVQALFPPLLSLHAATVEAGGRALAFAGESGAGKSSLCTAALLDGARYLSDEFTLLGEEGEIHPFPRPLQWDGGDHPVFTTGDMAAAGFEHSGYRFPGHNGVTRDSLLWHPPRVAREPMRAGFVFLPRYDPDAPPARLAPLPRARGLMELAAHVHQHLGAGERIRLLHQYLPEGASIHRLTFSDCRAAWRAAAALADQAPVHVSQ